MLILFLRQYFKCPLPYTLNLYKRVHFDLTYNYQHFKWTNIISPSNLIFVNTIWAIRCNHVVLRLCSNKTGTLYDIYELFMFLNKILSYTTAIKIIIRKQKIEMGNMSKSHQPNQIAEHIEGHQCVLDTTFNLAH